MIHLDESNRKKNLIYNKLLYKELSIVLNNIDFDYVIIKGEPLSYYAYGQYGMRYSTDIDILVDRSNVDKLNTLLKANGFICKSLQRIDKVTLFMYTHQYVPWYKKLDNGIEILIDVNCDIFWGEYTGKRTSINNFIRNNKELNIYGIKIKTLSIQTTFIQLVLHHYKEINSIYIMSIQNSIRFDILMDIYMLLKNNIKKLTVDVIYDISNKYFITLYAYYILYYTNILYPDPELSAYVNALYSKEGAELLECYGLSKEERRHWNCSFIERKNNTKLFDLIKSELNHKDFEKIEQNKYIFN